MDGIFGFFETQIFAVLYIVVAAVAVMYILNVFPGVNFTNVLSAAFTLVGPKSTKRHCKLDCLFWGHSGSASVKAASGRLMKLSPGFNTIKTQNTEKKSCKFESKSFPIRKQS